MRFPRLFRAAHLTTVLFAIAFFACIGAASAAPPVFNGDVVSATLPVYNVKYYGAKCDASTDDSTAIQNAVNAAEAAVTGGTARGGNVLIPGVCAIASTINITYGNVYLVGNGYSMNDVSPYSSSLKWIGSTTGTMVSFVPAQNATCTYCIIGGGGVENLDLDAGVGAKVGIAITAGQGMNFEAVSGQGFSESVIEEYKVGPSSNASNFHNDFKHLSCVDTVASGTMSCLWLKYGEFDFVYDLFGEYRNGWMVRLGGGPSGTTGETEDFSMLEGIHGIQIASGTGGNVLFDCGAFANQVNHISGTSTTSRGTATCTGTLSAAGVGGANDIRWWDNCDSNEGAPIVENGAIERSEDDCGNRYLDGNATPTQANTGYNFIEFGKSDIPSASVFVCRICIGKQNNAMSKAIQIANATGRTEIGNDSTTCAAGVVTGSALRIDVAGGGNGICFDGTNVGIGGYLAMTGVLRMQGTSVPNPIGTEGVIGTNGSGYTYIENSGGRFIFTNGSGATIAQIDNTTGYTSSKTISTSAHNACSSTSGVPCEATGTCALSAATTCNFTVTVPSSSVCTATPNASDTTTAVEQFKTSLSTNTLTVTELASSSQTATASANITCL